MDNPICTMNSLKKILLTYLQCEVNKNNFLLYVLLYYLYSKLSLLGTKYVQSTIFGNL